jgi:phosphatidylglycerol:prolipoprotein diacylglycerol transferase
MLVYPHIIQIAFTIGPLKVHWYGWMYLVRFIILWLFSAKRPPRAVISAMFLLCYGCFRFFVEFFRQPDPQLGFVAFGWMTRGQELSIPMIVIGAIMLIWAYKRAKKNKQDNGGANKDAAVS